MTTPVPYLSAGQRLVQQQQMSTPLSNGPDSRLLWKQRDVAREQDYRQWNNDSRIVPLADAVDMDSYAKRATSISDMGKNATAGAVANAQFREQQARLQEQRNFQTQQTQAINRVQQSAQNYINQMITLNNGVIQQRWI